MFRECCNGITGRGRIAFITFNTEPPSLRICSFQNIGRLRKHSKNQSSESCSGCIRIILRLDWSYLSSELYTYVRSTLRQMQYDAQDCDSPLKHRELALVAWPLVPHPWNPGVLQAWVRFRCSRPFQSGLERHCHIYH